MATDAGRHGIPTDTGCEEEGAHGGTTGDIRVCWPSRIAASFPGMPGATISRAQRIVNRMVASSIQAPTESLHTAQAV